jgi:DNA-binding PadR family transcriptional regulator
MAKVKSRVPRGFTRYYALNIINVKPSTGKELIEEAEKRSDGDWSPSPGLIYPLLGRLLRDGLINEGSEGRFVITEKGVKALEDHAKVQDQLERQIDLITRLGIVDRQRFKKGSTRITENSLSASSRSWRLMKKHQI